MSHIYLQKFLDRIKTLCIKERFVKIRNLIKSFMSTNFALLLLIVSLGAAIVFGIKAYFIAKKTFNKNNSQICIKKYDSP